jgi:hypothetical protein
VAGELIGVAYGGGDVAVSQSKHVGLGGIVW